MYSQNILYISFGLFRRCIYPARTANNMRGRQIVERTLWDRSHMKCHPRCLLLLKMFLLYNSYNLIVLQLLLRWYRICPCHKEYNRTIFFDQPWSSIYPSDKDCMPPLLFSFPTHQCRCIGLPVPTHSQIGCTIYEVFPLCSPCFVVAAGSWCSRRQKEAGQEGGGGRLA